MTLVERLRAAGCVYAEEEAALLLATASEHPDDPGLLERLVAARVRGRPLEHLLGWAEFDGLRITVTDGVFVPRRRTRLLVDLAAKHAAPGATVVDLCCGSGALLAALLARRPDVEGHAADLDPTAVATARSNLPTHLVHHGDLYAALPTSLRGHVDVLLVNAPYVPSADVAAMPPEAREHEHRMALDGGADGLDVHRRVVAEAPRWLAAGGVLVVEVADAQVDTLLAVVGASGLGAEVVVDDVLCATAVMAHASPGLPVS